MKFLKQILGVKMQTSNLAVLGETGRFPLLLRQRLNLVKYWQYIYNQPTDSISRSVYDELCNLSSSGHQNWTSKIERILNKYDMSGIWSDSAIDKIPDNFLNDFKLKLYSEFITSWFTEISDSKCHPILRTYVLFKQDYRLENYLHVIKDRSQRIAFARFRCISHHLRIETGRHSKPKLPIDERVCLYCKTGAIDNEIHFLTACEFHNVERKELLPHLSTFACNKEAFISTMTSKDSSLISNIGRYLHRAFQRRKTATI